MNLLVLRHEPSEPLGRLAPRLRAAGLTASFSDLYTPNAEIPEVAGLAGILLLGGSQSVNGNHPFLRVEKALLEQALLQGIPVLGICLGAQLLASTLGAAVRKCALPEIGWWSVRPTREASTDPLFRSFQAQQVFHWHNETFDLPHGCVRLAESDLCENQAFRYGDRAWGIQFHPEVEPATIERWLREDAACGQRECPQIVDPNFRKTELAAMAEPIFDAWLQLTKHE
ncbi:MAG: gamma-glutamyl-gamma-aminobutyrate hydrolase family protein [Candidatus Solibacter usitatus]|nr:gamma-glutamyl-gamma-aminobutyrate hydrolase family protein [Candidatus Solibacter usitatus]